MTLDPESPRAPAPRRATLGRRHRHRGASRPVIAAALVGLAALGVLVTLTLDDGGIPDGPAGDVPTGNGGNGGLAATTTSAPPSPTEPTGPSPVARLAARHPDGVAFAGEWDPEGCERSHLAGQMTVAEDGSVRVVRTVEGAPRSEATGQARPLGADGIVAWAVTGDTDPAEAWLLVATVTDAGTLVQVVHATGPPPSVTSGEALADRAETLAGVPDRSRLAVLDTAAAARALGTGPGSCAGPVNFAAVQGR